VVVGGGLPSLLFASLLSKKKKEFPIHIIESSNQAGGLFKSIENDQGDLFDQGMHIYYETEISEIDQSFLQSLPEDDWNYLEGNRKDIAGIYFNSKLQLNSPYPDLRTYSIDERNTFLISLFEPIENVGQEDCANVSDVLLNHFGRAISSKVFEPILEKIYGLSGKELDPIAFRLTAINRVVLFNESVVEDLMNSDYLSKRIAYPEQLHLPDVRKSRSRGIYPKKFGFGKVIDKIVQNLTESGVIFHCNSRVTEMNQEKNSVKSINFKNGNEDETQIIVEDGVLWTVDVFSLLRSMNESPKIKINTSLKRYVNLVLKTKPNMGELYYFYNFDKSSDIFRVTNYSAYCPNVSENSRFPICVEYWSKVELNKEQIRDQTIKDLLRMGIIESDEVVSHAEVSPIPILFPTPSVEAVTSIREASNLVEEKAITNLVLVGPLIKKDVFFLHEILKSGYRLMKEKKWL
jgi:oxygen-dependent protoporphyrinogen oxidase